MNNRIFWVICLLLAVGIVSAEESAVAATDAIDTTSAAESAIDTTKASASADTVETAIESPKDADTAKAAGLPVRSTLDLDRLLSEDDDEDDLLTGYHPAVTESAAAETADSAVVGSEQVAEQPDESGDSGNDAAWERMQRGGRGGRVPPVALEDAAEEPVDLGPAIIEDGLTINFAQNLQGYRSPRVAMLLSLLVPGWGQAYSRNYVKAAAFGAAEIAVIGVAAYLNSVGNSKRRDAYRFADKNFDIDKMREYETRLRDAFNDPNRNLGDTTQFPSNYYNDYFYNAANRKSSFFYQSVGDIFFTPGWNDSDPLFDGIFSVRDSLGTLIPTDTIYGAGGSVYVRQTKFHDLFFFLTQIVDEAGNRVNNERILGFSKNQAKYNSMIKDANSYSNAVNYTFYALIVNHIVSAIDAGFTARAYNARLLGREETVWDRISVEQQYVFTGSEVSPGIALRVQF